MTIQQLAMLVHEAQRGVAEAAGDTTLKPWSETPDWQREATLYGIHMILSGAVTSPEQSHAEWMAFKVSDGWTYGPAKDAEAKRHPCILPYAKLPVEHKTKDFVFFALVRAAVPLLDRIRAS